MLVSFVVAIAMVLCFAAGLVMFELLLASSKGAVWGLLPIVFFVIAAVLFGSFSGLRIGMVMAFIALMLLVVYFWGRKRKKRLDALKEEKNQPM